VKRISPAAYEALREALPVFTWNKRPFETYLRTALRETPELLAGLNFSEPKRLNAGLLVDRLIAGENRYRDTTIALMLEIGSMTEFPNIAQIADKNDRARWLGIAKDATAYLRTFTEAFEQVSQAREQAEVAREAARQETERRQHLARTLNSTRDMFLAMHSASDPHKRGRDFEKLLSELFVIYDMEPRLAYSLDAEQIDGSLTFDTDDYIVEARWRAGTVSRADADVFAAKVHRKGKNALGLLISVNGFSGPALDTYRVSTPFLAVTGSDLFAVMDQRVRLDDLLKAKKRYANETGDCLYSVEQML